MPTKLKKPVGSVRPKQSSTVRQSYIARCGNPRCDHQWMPRSNKPLKCSQCQNEHPEVYLMTLAKAAS